MKNVLWFKLALQKIKFQIIIVRGGGTNSNFILLIMCLLKLHTQLSKENNIIIPKSPTVLQHFLIKFLPALNVYNMHIAYLTNVILIVTSCDLWQL
jgi:hypothetical protein